MSVRLTIPIHNSPYEKHGYLIRLEIDTHDPSFSTLAKLANALNMKVAKFME